MDFLEGSNFCPDPEAPGGAVGKESLGASGTPTHGSTGADLITLARETISIRFTAMRSFLPQLLVPGSVSFVLLERQILQQVRWHSEDTHYTSLEAGLPAWRQHPAMALWRKAVIEGTTPWGRGFSEGGGDCPNGNTARLCKQTLLPRTPCLRVRSLPGPASHLTWSPSHTGSQEIQLPGPP